MVFRTHGLSRTRLHTTWTNMRRRCLSPSTPCFHLYGGRGITICPEWSDFMVFRTWALANGYADNLTIERRDSNGHYEPGNCTWVPQSEQPKNTRLIKRAPDGRRWKDIAISNGLGGAFEARVYRLGWSFERAATEPLRLPRTKCRKGHELIGADRCRICANARQQAWRTRCRILSEIDTVDARGVALVREAIGAVCDLVVGPVGS